MHQLGGGDAIHFVQALARASVTDIDPMTYAAFCGASTEQGLPQIITFHSHDLKRIMNALGISHWGDNVLVIMDDGGVVFNGWMDGTAFAFQVVLQLTTTVWDGDFPVARGLHYVPEVGYSGPNDMLRFRRSYDPGKVDTWAVYAGKPRGDGMDCLERFSNEAAARRYVERENYR